MSRSINRATLDLIKSFESFRLEAYICPGNKLTIGYGHKILANENYKKISQKQANLLLKQDLLIAKQAVGRNINHYLTDNQFGALVSFTYNLGGAALQRSTLRQKINRGQYQAVASELNRWVYVAGKIMPGLILRRQAETRLFYQSN